MQSTAAQFIQVRIHLMFHLTQGENLDCNPFFIGADAVWAAEQRGPQSRSYPRQGPVNDVAYHGTCEDQLRNPKLRSASRSLTQDATRHLVQSLILSRIDYCNVTFASLPQRSIIQLQVVIKAAPRLVLRVKNSTTSQP